MFSVFFNIYNCTQYIYFAGMYVCSTPPSTHTHKHTLIHRSMRTQIEFACVSHTCHICHTCRTHQSSAHHLLYPACFLFFCFCFCCHISYFDFIILFICVCMCLCVLIFYCQSNVVSIVLAQVGMLYVVLHVAAPYVNLCNKQSNRKCKETEKILKLK